MRLETLETSGIGDASPADRGEALGRALGLAHAAQLRESARLYLGFFDLLGLGREGARDIAERSLAALVAWRPALARELLATAEAAGLEPWRLAMVDARTEVLAAAGHAAPECSTLVHAPGAGPVWSMQTWDWHGELVPAGLVWSLRGVTGRRIVTFTEFGAQAKIGVNDAGVGVHFNILSHASDGGGDGVPLHSVARAILEEATTVEEAVAIVRSAPLAASSAFTVVGATGSARSSAVSIEASPAGVAAIAPDDDGWLLRTNHFLDPVLARGDTIPADSATRARLERLTAARGDLRGSIRRRSAALYGPDGEGAVLCFRPDPAAAPPDRWETLLTVGIEPAVPELLASPRAPDRAARTGFRRFRPPAATTLTLPKE